jgi:hypothetical protein
MSKLNIITILLFFILSNTSFYQIYSEENQNAELISAKQTSRTAFTSDYFHLNGYAQVIAHFNEYPNVGQIKTSTNNSFDIARAILFAEGKLGKKQDFGYYIMYDFGANSCLHELYGEWLPADYAKLRFGQFKIPFTMENPMAPVLIETIYFTRSISAMCGSAGDVNQFSPTGENTGVKVGRDIGMQLYGSLFKQQNYYSLDYYLGLFNGTGMNAKDNNNTKDIVGSLYWHIDKNIRIGASFYDGKYLHSNNGELMNEKRQGWTAGVEYSNKYLLGRSEYVAMKNGEIERNGFYLTAMWKAIPNKLEIVGKYDYYDKSMPIDSNKTQDTTAGINYYFSLFSRLQLNYIYTDDKILGKNNALALQLQLFF